MSTVEHLRGFVNKRLTAAAEEIFSVFSKTIVEYEEVIHRQHKLLAILWKHEKKLHRTELPKQHVCKEEEVLSDRQLCIQERNSSLDQEDPEPPQIKEEQEDLCISQEGEPFEMKQETETFMLNPIDEEKLPQQHVRKEEEVLSDQQLCIKERNSSLDQEGPTPPQIKEEQEELCTSHKREQFELKQETETFMLTRRDEENDHIEDQTVDLNPDKSQSAAETDLPASMCIICLNDESEWETPEVSDPNSDHQLLSHNSHVAESQGLKESKDGDSGSISNVEPELNTRLPISTSHTNDISKPTMSTIQVNTHTETKSLKCDICEKAFKNNSDWQIHQRIHTGKKLHSCNTCGKRFTDKSKLNSHIRIHSGEKPFTCTTCGKDFRYNSNLLVHMRRAHTGEKPYSCNTCGKNYCSAFELKAHIRIHTGERPFSCNTCGKRFSKKSVLTSHIQIHSGEKPYSCKVCGKDFGRSGYLLVHMRTHTGEKPYSCNTCGKRFSKKSVLTRHIQIHSGVKPYSCKICGKDFGRNSNLLVHMRTHTGEKPYSCNTCGKIFSKKSVLTRHIQIHLGEKPYSCKICGKDFGRNSNLLVHMRTHTGEKPYSCNICGKKYSRTSDLKIHIRIHMGEKPHSCTLTAVGKSSIRHPI